jgi:SAM-dependent methyltransferase
MDSGEDSGPADAARSPPQRWAGICPICEGPARFIALGDWYRDDLRCEGCNSLPRERALMRVIATLYPDWRERRIHESSAVNRGASLKLRRECPAYLASQYIPSMTPGTRHPNGFVIEDLERQTFVDESFDIVVTQDVFEHLFQPDRAIREIARTLRPGGAHIMTVPIVNKGAASARRASLAEGRIVHHAEPQYHGNPVGDGSLVTIDWGYDIADYLTHHSGLPTTIVQIDDPGMGIRAEYLDVVVSRKGAVPELGS